MNSTLYFGVDMIYFYLMIISVTFQRNQTLQDMRRDAARIISPNATTWSRTRLEHGSDAASQPIAANHPSVHSPKILIHPKSGQGPDRAALAVGHLEDYDE